MNIMELIGESTEYDKKQALEVKKPKSWCKSVSAFANGIGGSLVFGISDDDVIIGLADAEHDAEIISEQIKERLNPIPSFNLRFHRTNDDKVIIILYVYSGDQTPYYYDEDGTLIAFQRVGNQSVPVTPAKYIQDEFEEIYYRRNLFIHNNGNVNSIYLSNVKDKFTKDIKVDQRLATDDIYLRHAINMLYKIVCTLFYETQVEYNAKYDKWIEGLGNIAFDLLNNKNYEVAEQIYLSLSNCKHFCFKDKAMFKINYINSLKQLSKMKEVEKELESFDVTIATTDFKIAKLCLEDNNEEVYNLLQETYPTSYSADQIRDWPIFINFRETEFYQQFVQEHQTDFGMFVFEFENGKQTCDDEEKDTKSSSSKIKNATAQ